MTGVNLMTGFCYFYDKLLKHFFFCRTTDKTKIFFSKILQVRLKTETKGNICLQYQGKGNWYKFYFISYLCCVLKLVGNIYVWVEEIHSFIFFIVVVLMFESGLCGYGSIWMF